MTAKEGLRIAMEKKERQFKNEIEALEFQVYYVAYTTLSIVTSIMFS